MEKNYRMLDFFPDDFLLVIDESHVTVPQIGAMYEGDANRKRTRFRACVDANQTAYRRVDSCIADVL